MTPTFSSSFLNLVEDMTKKQRLAMGLRELIKNYEEEFAKNIFFSQHVINGFNYLCAANDGSKFANKQSIISCHTPSKSGSGVFGNGLKITGTGCAGCYEKYNIITWANTTEEGIVYVQSKIENGNQLSTPELSGEMKSLLNNWAEVLHKKVFTPNVIFLIRMHKTLHLTRDVVMDAGQLCGELNSHIYYFTQEVEGKNG